MTSVKSMFLKILCMVPFGAVLLFSLGALNAQPSNQAPGQVVAATVKPLPLFAHAGDAKPALKVVPEGLPWAILEERDDFLRVRVGENEYWVDSMHVRATRSVIAKCVVLPGRANSPVGATPGAAENPCVSR